MQQDVPVFIIEPVALFREGLRRILCEARFQAVWCSDRSPLGPIASLNDKVSPLLIVGHEVEEAIVTIAEVQRHYPMSRVVLLVERVVGPEMIVALRAGATMVLDRASSCETLIGALELVMTGATVLPSELLRSLLTDRALPAPNALQLIRESSPESPTQLLDHLAPWGELGSSGGRSFTSESASLSKREFAVLEHLQRGLSNKEIASRLDIAEATVKVHVKAILRKARLRNRTEAAMWASGHRAATIKVNGVLPHQDAAPITRNRQPGDVSVIPPHRVARIGLERVVPSRVM